jgi:hypothetical protein
VNVIVSSGAEQIRIGIPLLRSRWHRARWFGRLREYFAREEAQRRQHAAAFAAAYNRTSWPWVKGDGLD